MLRQSIVGTLTGVMVFQYVPPISARDASQAENGSCQCMRLFDLRNALATPHVACPPRAFPRDLGAGESRAVILFNPDRRNGTLP
jgi:hypothetical protein